MRANRRSGLARLAQTLGGLAVLSWAIAVAIRLTGRIVPLWLVGVALLASGGCGALHTMFNLTGIDDKDTD